ncbi:MAG: nitrilase-related carbon-nitrogen hydrolase [Candidatus Ranarchaeia archaeon]
MIAAAVQMDVILGDVSANISKMERFIQQAIAQKVDLIVFPELCTSGYNFQTKEDVRSVSEEIPSGPSTSKLQEIAKKGNITIVFGIPEIKNDVIYNSAVVLSPQGYLGTYRKLHLFGKEKLLFTPGDKTLKVYDINQYKIGPMICFDWFFPESTRILALQGADIICHSANLVLPYAQQVMPAYSIVNRVYTITANRVGSEKGLRFTGCSQITNVNGIVIVKAQEKSEEIITARIEISKARNKTIGTYNDIFKDRRPEMYRDLV